MHEHIFKAKERNGGEWVHGSHVAVNGKDMIVPNYASALYGIDVDGKTVCQAIGTKDVEGVDVFDGDKILVIEGPHSGEEFFVKASMITPTLIGHGTWAHMHEVFGDCKFRVVGNVWDNGGIMWDDLGY